MGDITKGKKGSTVEEMTMGTITDWDGEAETAAIEVGRSDMVAVYQCMKGKMSKGAKQAGAEKYWTTVMMLALNGDIEGYLGVESKLEDAERRAQAEMVTWEGSWGYTHGDFTGDREPAWEERKWQRKWHRDAKREDMGEEIWEEMIEVTAEAAEPRPDLHGAGMTKTRGMTQGAETGTMGWVSSEEDEESDYSSKHSSEDEAEAECTVKSCAPEWREGEYYREMTQAEKEMVAGPSGGHRGTIPRRIREGGTQEKWEEVIAQPQEPPPEHRTRRHATEAIPQWILEEMGDQSKAWDQAK